MAKAKPQPVSQPSKSAAPVVGASATSIVELFTSANADTLIEIDRKLEELKRRAFEIDGQIAALSAIRRSIDWRVNGRPIRKNKKRNVASEDRDSTDDENDDEQGDDLETRIAEWLAEETSGTTKEIADAVGASPNEVSLILREEERFTMNNAGRWELADD